MWNGVLNFNSVSKPSIPFALVASGTLCHAESCSRLSQVIQADEKPHFSKPLARSFFAASNNSGHVFGGALMPILASASLLYHMTADDELNGIDSISPFKVE